MGRSKEENFNRRFGDRIVVTYLDKPLNPAEQKILNDKIVQTFNKVLTEFLGREPSRDELLGLEEITPKKKKKKSLSPP